MPDSTRAAAIQLSAFPEKADAPMFRQPTSRMAENGQKQPFAIHQIQAKRNPPKRVPDVGFVTEIMLLLAVSILSKTMLRQTAKPQPEPERLRHWS